MTIALIIISLLAAAFAAVALRFYIDNREWSDLAAEIQRENEALRENNSALCGEKLQQAREIDEMKSTLSAARHQLADALGALEDVTAERNELLTARLHQNVVTESVELTAPQFVPVGNSNTFRCEDYKFFVNNSEQKMLQEDCFTNPETGIRYYVADSEIYYCAAMATAYGTTIGQAYRVTLECGTVFNVILADFKHPIDNPDPFDFGDNDRNYDGNPCINVIEFVVDMEKVPASVKTSGTMSALAAFGGLYGTGGNIKYIEKLERVWRA